MTRARATREAAVKEPARTRVLIVDDDPPLCELLTLSLSAKGFAATTRTSAEAALTALSSDDFDVLVTDLNLPRMDGIELCRRVSSERPDLPVVVLTAFGSQDAAVAALRAGALDFITKPVHMDEVGKALERAALLRGRPVVAHSEDEGAADEILGESPVMHRLRALVARAAASDASVLVTGESGTGKELVARALHNAGRRAAGPFVALNCAAMPESLLESELFGHVRGAFTDAKASRQGLFVLADGGTLFLDELGEMSLTLQPKLLRALQERIVRPVGGMGEIPFDARIIAATNEDIAAAVAERRFRSDLYFRINVIHIEVPPLRDRGADVVLLAQRFALAYAARHGKRVTGLSREATDRLRGYSWPGNVRELQNCIERAVALTERAEIGADDLSETVLCPKRSPALSRDDLMVSLAEVERRHVLRVLDAVQGNKRLAARVLGLDRRTLYRKLDQYNAPPRLAAAPARAGGDGQCGG